MRRLAILTYHRVLKTADPLRPGEMFASCFENHMKILSIYFNVLPLLEAVRRLRAGELPPRAVSISFDDGYADNYHVALPVLRRFRLPATVFVATGYLDGGRMWNDAVIEAIRRIDGDEIDLQDLGLGCHPARTDAQRSSVISGVLKHIKYLDPRERVELTSAIVEKAGEPVPDDLMLTTDEVRELSRAGIEIGAHTITHPILKSIDEASARDEINGGKKRLEEITGTRIRSFAYPNGKPGVDYDPVHVQLAREAGFDCAVSTSHGAASSSSDVLQLPRIGPWAESAFRFGLRTLRMYL